MSNPSAVQRCPAQKRTFDHLSSALQAGSLVHLWGGVGRGKTTMLKELHQQIGGVLLTVKDFVEASARNHPLALEETLYRLLFDALRSHPAVMVDDVHLVDLFSGCHFY